MSSETLALILTISGAVLTYTATVIGIMLWLMARFQANERLVYREVAKTRRMLIRVLNQHSGRITRLELQVNGSALSDLSVSDPINYVEPTDDDDDDVDHI